MSLTSPLTSSIRNWVLRAFPRNPELVVMYDEPAGDPGLFGPDSATWKIHADFCGMLSGGLCALMLQTLHPLALAGVWDHSNFRHDLIGRLRRTTGFVAATSYATTAPAQALIGQIRRIHDRVHGATPDGRPYSANDPALLTWVHVTEAYGFLEGYRRYRHVPLPRAAADRYYSETRRVAEALGARDVPSSQAEIEDYFRSVQNTLEFSERSHIVLGILAEIQLPVPVAGLTRNLFLGAGAALLPDWAVTLLQRTPLQRWQSRVAANVLHGIAPLVRAALADGVASRSCRRVGVDPALLDQW